jgi:hypothetical protein
LTGGKLGVAEGEAPPPEPGLPGASGEKKPVLGKRGRRYSQRL